MNSRILESYVKKLDITLLFFSLPLIPMMIAEIFVGVGDEVLGYFNVYYIALWFLFIIEFFSKFYLAENKIQFIRVHWLDTLVVLSPVFRSLKIFHILRTPILLVSDELIEMFKVLRLNFLYFFLVTIVVILIASDVVLFFEKEDPASHIQSFGDAVWWGFVTFSTLGYGDFVPITFGGRVVAILLMTLGFALFGILVSTAIAFFMKKRQDEGADFISNAKSAGFVEDVKEENKLDAIMERLDRLEEKIDKKTKTRKKTNPPSSGKTRKKTS